MSDTMSIYDLETIRDVVPHLDLSAIRALRRAGYVVVRDFRVIAPKPTLALATEDAAIMLEPTRSLLDHPV